MSLRGIDVSLYIDLPTMGCDTSPVCADKKLIAKRKIIESAIRFIIVPP